MSADCKLILFDIDGTLLDTSGAGLSALEEGFFAAFPECQGKAFPQLDLGGATDRGVANFLFDHFGLGSNEEATVSFFEAYAECLERQLRDFGSNLPGGVLEGIPELLEALQAIGQFEFGLLTGNTEDGASLKLKYYGLRDYFSHGAFGSDHHDRNQLGPIALARAHQSSGRQFSAQETLVIGDTLKDIACARAFGARVLAVATGAVDEPRLREAKPDRCLSSFSDLATSVDAIESLFV